MKVLILGGTRFLGKALVKEGLTRGHEITLFNRGKNKGAFPEVEQLIGDRDGDVSSLRNRRWDAVMDTCGFVPQQIKKIAAALGDTMEHYTYVSSISVYKDWVPHKITEDYHLQLMSPSQLRAVEEGAVSLYEHYGALKALCEEEAETHWPGRVLKVRAGLLVGAFDYTDRLPYWVQRVAQGGKVLVPGSSDRLVQLIDVSDIAKWVFDMAEKGNGGTFNVTGPSEPLTMEELLNTCKGAANSDCEWVWTDESFLLERGVQPWTEMPLWVPEHFPLEGEAEPWKGASSISIEKAVKAGLTFRPLRETIEEVHNWLRTRQDVILKAGISREREQELVKAWFQKGLR